MAARIAKTFTGVLLGTSLTAGRLCTPDRQWDRELHKQLVADPVCKGKVSIVNLGQGSQTSNYGVTRIPQVQGLRPDFFLLEGFAINDCAIGPVSLAQAEANLESIIVGARAGNAEVKIALMTMSPAHSSDTNRTNLGTYEQQVRDVATANDCDLIDNRVDWLAANPGGLLTNQTVAGDNLHPLWRGTGDIPSFDTYSFPNILAQVQTWMAEFYA